jgi:hypothetical protein
MPYLSPMPDNTTFHKKQCINKHTLLVPEGSNGGKVSKKARTSGPMKQDLANKLHKVKGKWNNVVSLLITQCWEKLTEELQRIREENKRLQDAAAEAKHNKIKEVQRKVLVPRKQKNQKGPSHVMGDIIQLLDDMTDVKDAEDYYGSAQVSKPPLNVRIVLTLALQRYIKVAIKAANLNLMQTYKNC